ncbi:methylmalonyl-CoA mutase subunit beta [Flavivirga amylovorans]|uniref:Methylmalonyl-CoA mutase subunit beta n=1 Tax=Flavivirga amylovorans TaxID=870486 RepID=A0ABT8WWR4_9FLAO|nr:methylmalonyl-CoA mutase subunit beta [Flavivirga amylovorans]MDO5986129.1 methylmalonyl-CoA mutase subunit beta [Flavivirga amylovorans]
MSNKLFKEFDSVSAKQWKQKIQFDLKGADYNDTLVWQTNEDISVKPFYHADDFKEQPKISNSETTTWNICQFIFVSNAKNANQKAIDAIERGAESIKFIIPSETILINDLLENINPASTPLYFELQFLSETYVKQLTAILSDTSTYIYTDIINNLAKSGNWYHNLKDDFSKFKAITTHTKSLLVDASLYQNAGANIVQQLAYTLAHANEYLNCFENDNNILSTLEINFNVSVSTNYFFEIAKLRALRILWEVLAAEYNVNTNCHILATPTKRNKTLYDYNTNMLRTTTECMSAILGGANSIYNLPYDAIYHKDNEFGERISRNQLLVLKHESYFDIVKNPSDGTFYIESLTDQLAEKALDLFKNIEENGGFLKQLKEGTIQRKIKENASKEDVQFNAGENILLGTNKHPNADDTMKQELELYPFVKTNQRKTLIEPIIEKRLAEKIEQERLKNEH